ncbi:sulfotransferase, partial [Bacteroidota bacterium]
MNLNRIKGKILTKCMIDGQYNLLERIYKKLLAGRLSLKKTVNQEIYFIISTGRTGTNFFESFLNNASKDVYCVHEPQPDLFNISNNKLRHKQNKRVISEQLRKARASVLVDFLNSSKTKYIESNPFAAFLVEDLKMLFPTAKFIIIYRDIDTYLLSAMNKSPLNNNINNFYADSDGRKRIGACDFSKDPHNDQWNELRRSQKIAWFWNKCNQYLLEFESKNQDKVMSLKFEDFFTKESELQKCSMKKVLHFLGIT